MLFRVVVALTLALTTSSLAQNAINPEIIWRAKDNMITFGPPQTSATVAIACDRGKLTMSVNDLYDAENAKVSWMTFSAFGSAQALPVQFAENGDILFNNMPPTSPALAALMLDQGFVISYTDKQIPVPGAGAGNMARNLVTTCLAAAAGVPVQSQMTAPPVAPPAKSAPAIPLPKFREFPANFGYSPTPPQAILDTPQKVAYRTRIREATKQTPNFAGHYVVSVWGCGTSCVTGVVVDRNTGEASWLPGSISGWGMVSDDFEPTMYKPTSNLIVLFGMINEEEGSRGAHFYRFANGQFIKLATVPMAEDMPEYSKIATQL